VLSANILEGTEDGIGEVVRCNAEELLEVGFVFLELVCDAKVRAGCGSLSRYKTLSSRPQDLVRGAQVDFQK